MVQWHKTRGARTSIGLDVGSTGVRAVQLVCVGERFETLNAFRNERARTDLDSVDVSLARRIERIRACVPVSSFRGRKAVASLDAPDVEFHALDMPRAVLTQETQDGGSAIQWEVARLMNASADSVEVRHWPLPAASTGASNAIGVGAQRERILETVEACTRAGLYCSSVETSATALTRLGSVIHRWPSETVWGVLDLGHRGSRLVLCVDEVPVLVRLVGSGGDSWTRSITESLHLSRKAAEIHKCEHGIALAGRGLRQTEGSVPDSELAAILLNIMRPELNEITAEVKRSYEYILSCYAGRQAGDLVLVGGGAAMKNLPEYWSEALGITVRRVSDYLNSEHCRLQYASGREGDGKDHLGSAPLEAMATAFGLAIGSVA
ncbi:MAG: pilus assembly protein PilM [Planctomycetes bacterium]|nr:pilus assembly protein PilM [Planctomycetota bacterium]